MNSDAVLRRLNTIALDRSLSDLQRETIELAIKHIKGQDDYLLDLRDDITDLTTPPSGENHDTKR
jgi:hypothetical protein